MNKWFKWSLSVLSVGGFFSPWHGPDFYRPSSSWASFEPPVSWSCQDMSALTWSKEFRREIETCRSSTSRSKLQAPTLRPAQPAQPVPKEDRWGGSGLGGLHFDHSWPIPRGFEIIEIVLHENPQKETCRKMWLLVSGLSPATFIGWI